MVRERVCVCVREGERERKRERNPPKLIWATQEKGKNKRWVNWLERKLRLLLGSRKKKKKEKRKKNTRTREQKNPKNIPYVKITLFFSTLFLKYVYGKYICCIFLPASGCCALQTLVEMVIFSNIGRVYCKMS